MTQTIAASKAKYFDAIQILRAIAAWTIVYVHYTQLYGMNFLPIFGNRLYHYGNFGVDVFFLISGFIMFESVRKRDQTPAQFMKRRIARIVPNYWLYTGLLIVCGTAFPVAFSRFTPFTSDSVAKSILFIPNQNPSGIGVFPTLTVGWTLNFEMLFYGLYAICLFLPRKYTGPAAVAILMFLSRMGQIFPHVMPFLGPFGLFITGHWLRDFAFGICIAMLYSVWTPSGKWWRISGVAICGASLAYLLADGQRDVAATTLVWGMLCLQFQSSHPFFQFVKHLGDTSYSTYLCHIIVIALFLGLTGTPTSAWMELSIVAAITVVTFVMSELSYRFVERFSQPHSRLKKPDGAIMVLKVT